jgi:YVTN family beta-propeller protein
MRHRRTWIALACCIAAVALPRIGFAFDPQPLTERAAFRRPAAAVLVDDGRTLLVANGAGTVSVVDIATRAVVAEQALGGSLTDIAVAGDVLLVTDFDRHELLALRRDGSELSVASRIAVPRYPVSVRVTPDGRRAIVCSLWSRRLCVIDIPTADDEPRVVGTLDLPFAPRAQTVLADGRVLVAEAFGGRLAVVEPEPLRLAAVRSVPGHNLRDILLHGGRVLLSQQLLNPLAYTTADDIHWGSLMTNAVRSLDAGRLNDAEPLADVLRSSRLHLVGGPRQGAADPAGIVPRLGGGFVVALSGVDEVALFTSGWQIDERVKVGRRPTALVADPHGPRVYVVNSLSDSVSVIDTNRSSVIEEISLGPMPEPTAAERGERMFFSGRLALDGWMSCHSCHTDGHTNNLSADTLGDGTYGTPKRVPPLGGVADTNDWAWDGSVRELVEQVHTSVELSMRGEPIAPSSARELVSYLFTLRPAPSLIDARGERDDPKIEAGITRGETVFRSLGCATCHVPPLTYTIDTTFDVGLADEEGKTKFNPPSLRGVSQRSALFHDGRAKSLEEVIGDWSHQIDRPLTDAERRDLLVFLRSL